MKAEINRSGYAQRDGRLMHVSEVARGLVCGCYCLKCNARMVARKGLKRRAHFAHYVRSDCSGSAETAVHLLAKEILQQLPNIAIPPYVFRLPSRLDKTNAVSKGHRIVDGGTARIDHAESEVAIGGIVADSMIISGRKKLIIEIAVTHRVEKLKVRKLRRIGLPELEIQLCTEDSLKTRIELSDTIQTNVANKEWIFHPKQRLIELKSLRMLREHRKKERASRRTERQTTTQSPVVAPHVSVSRQQRYAARDTASENGWSSRKIRKWDTWVYGYHRKHGVLPSAEDTKQWMEANNVAWTYPVIRRRPLAQQRGVDHVPPASIGGADDARGHDEGGEDRVDNDGA